MAHPNDRELQTRGDDGVSKRPHSRTLYPRGQGHVAQSGLGLFLGKLRAWRPPVHLHTGTVLGNSVRLRIPEEVLQGRVLHDTNALALPVERHSEWFVAYSEILADPKGQLMNPHTGLVVFETVGVGLRVLRDVKGRTHLEAVLIADQD